MRPKRTTKPKVMSIRSFRFFTRILCWSNHLGCSFSLYPLVDLARTYENEWSHCSNDQIIKNLWLLEVHNLDWAAQISKIYKKSKKKKCVPNRRPSQKLRQFEVSDFLRAFYAGPTTLDAGFLFTRSQISHERMKTSDHNARMTKLSKTYGFWKFIILIGMPRSRKFT